jgi:hypothetical protein
MLLRCDSDFSGETRLYIKTKHGEAWIARIVRRSPEEQIDWNIWVRERPGEPGRTRKSPRRLAIESVLRAWLLRRYKRCLRSLSFHELCAIAEREAGGANKQSFSS